MGMAVATKSRRSCALDGAADGAAAAPSAPAATASKSAARSAAGSARSFDTSAGSGPLQRRRRGPDGGRRGSNLRSIGTLASEAAPKIGVNVQG